jgi:hypothetical protein
MSLIIQSKKNVKIRFQKCGNSVIHTDQIPAFQGFGNLQLIGGEGTVEEFAVTGDNFLSQTGRIGYVKALLCCGQPAAGIIENSTGSQIMPHAGCVAISCAAVFHNTGNIFSKIIQIPVENVDVNAILKGTVILIFPEMITDFHVGAVPTQNLASDFLRNRSSAVKINIVVRLFVIGAACTGPAQCNRFDLRKLRQFEK